MTRVAIVHDQGVRAAEACISNRTRTVQQWNNHSAGLRFVITATAVTAIGGYLFGYDTAVINGAISYLKADMGLDATQEGMAGASAILGCIPGAMCAGLLSDRFGRKKMLFLCAALFRGLRHSLRSSPDLRAIPRRAVSERAGDRSVVDHLSGLHRRDRSREVARTAGHALSARDRRSASSSRCSSTRSSRDWVTRAWNTSMGWRWMLGLEAVPAIIFLGLLFTVPESPRWLAQRGQARRGTGHLREGRRAGTCGPGTGRDRGCRRARGGPFFRAVHGHLSAAARDCGLADGLVAILRDQRDHLLFVADFRLGGSNE